MSDMPTDGRTPETATATTGDVAVSTQASASIAEHGSRSTRPGSRAKSPASNPDVTPGSTLTPDQWGVSQAFERLGQRRGAPRRLGGKASAGRWGWRARRSLTNRLSRRRDKGFLSRVTGQPRTAVVRPLSPPGIHAEFNERLVDIASRAAVYVPLVGRIAAGEPIPAQQSIEEFFPLPRELVGDGRLLLLEVTGDSMIQAAIADGDWVVVREQSVAENGEIVAAMIDGDATVKTFTRSADRHVSADAA